MQGVPDRPGTSLEIFSRIAARNISVDMIVQNVGDRRARPTSRSPCRERAGRRWKRSRGGRRASAPKAFTSDDNVAKVSVVGLGMAKQTGVAQQDVPRPGRRGHQHPDDHDQRDQDLGAGQSRPRARRPCGSCIRRSRSTRSRPRRSPRPRTGHRSRIADAAAVVARLQGMNMEDLTIDDVVARRLAGPRHDQRRARQAGHRGQGVRETSPPPASSSI